MTYKEVVDHIKEVATANGAASFWYGKETAKDINYGAAFPQVYLFMVPDTLKNGRITHRIRMCFYGNDEPSSSNEESLLIQDAMDKLSQRFIGALEEEGAGELDEVSRAPIMRQGSAQGTGFFVSFAFKTMALC